MPLSLIRNRWYDRRCAKLADSIIDSSLKVGYGALTLHRREESISGDGIVGPRVSPPVTVRRNNVGLEEGLEELDRNLEKYVTLEAEMDPSRPGGEALEEALSRATKRIT